MYVFFENREASVNYTKYHDEFSLKSCYHGEINVIQL